MERLAKELLQNIGINVARRRRELGLSQETFAVMAGIDRTYLSQIERSAANPSIEILCSVAKALKTTFAELIVSGPD